MALYASIRGWVEVGEEEYSSVKQYIETYTPTNEYSLTREQISLYMKGWNFQKETINWTYYFFFGADIQIHGLKYFKDLLESLCKKFDELEGFFLVSEEGNYDHQKVWKFSEGAFQDEIYKNS